MELSPQPSQPNLTVVLDCRFGSDFSEGCTSELLTAATNAPVKLLFDKKPRFDLIPAELITQQRFEAYEDECSLFFDLGYELNLSPGRHAIIFSDSILEFNPKGNEKNVRVRPVTDFLDPESFEFVQKETVIGTKEDQVP